MGLFLPQRWRRQPQYPVGVNWGNPLTRDLSLLVLPGVSGAANQVSNIIPTPSGYSALATENGMASVMSAGTSNGLSYGNVKKVIPDASSTYTLLAFAKPGSGDGRCSLVGQSDASGGSFPQYTLDANIRFDTAAVAGQFALVEYSGGILSSADSTAAAIDGKWHIFAGVRNGAASANKMYLDGVDVTNTTSGGSSTHTATEYVIVGGMFGQSFAAVFPIALAAVWSRSVTASEHAELAANIWQLFAPLPARRYFGPTAGAPASIDLMGQACL
jgi:hypothetical protein